MQLGIIMQNIIVQLVKRKIWIESDPNFKGASARVIAYATVEFDEGLIVTDISIRQDIDNPSDIRVIFPFRKVHDETVPYIKFKNPEIEKEAKLNILSMVESTIINDLK